MNVAILKDVLKGASKELGATTRAGFFEIALEAVDQVEKGKPFQVDILLSPETAALANGLHAQFGDAANIITEFAQACLTDTMTLPAAVVSVMTQSEAQGEGGQPDLARMIAGSYAAYNSALVVVCDPVPPEGKAAFPTLEAQEGLQLILTIEAEVGGSIQGFLDEKPTEAAQIAADKSLLRIARYAQRIISDEMKSLELRKLLLGDDLASARRPGGGGGNPDMTNRIRTILQKNLQDAERAFKLKYDELNRVNKGEFQILANDASSRISENEIVHISLASKTETIETEIEPAFHENFSSRLRAEFLEKMELDEKYLSEVKKMTIDQINALLNSASLKKINTQNIHAQEPQPELVLDSHFYTQKKYRGEITKDGVMQYFIALRDYTGMIMVLVGILAPLTLVAASQDAAPGGFFAFVNAIGLVLKKFRTILTLITAILVAIMLIYGYFDLRKRIPQKRIEERERDVTRAQESLEQEGRRMFNDASRDWVTQVGTYLRDLSASINGEIEQSMRSQSIQIAEAQEQQRRKVGLEQASVDSRLKGVSVLERKLEPIIKG